MQFDHPMLLLLALLAIPLWIVGWRALRGMDRVRRVTALLLRTVLLAALAIILAGPSARRTHDHLTVIGLLDISGSVQRFAQLPELAALGNGSTIDALRQWFRLATATREPDDRFGLIVFDGAAMAISAPTKGQHLDDNLDITTVEGTNIADAIRLGLAMFPPDTARRLVLVSDGNQTIGDAVEAAKQAAGGRGLQVQTLSAADVAANLDRRDGGAGSPRAGSRRATDSSESAIGGVPIDVAPIAYNVTSDVQIIRVEAPSSARPGQIVNVRIVLEATAPVTGRLTLLRERAPVDLNGPEQGNAIELQLPQGQSVHVAQVALAETPVNRFEAVWEPLTPGDDILPDNNQAAAFTATPTRGRMLIVARGADRGSNPLAATLLEAELPVEVLPPAALPDDPLSLQAYDLVILDNIAASELSTAQQQHLADAVNDMGLGLIMVGGEDSFGVGGWNNTPVEAVLPVELDPPKELRLPSAALALVLDKSGSMNRPVAGARASQQEVANEGAALAIESLRSESLVGVIAFDLWPHVRVPLQRNDDPAASAAIVRGLRADGGTAIEPALEAAFEMLRDAQVEKKHVVLMTDGRSPWSRREQLVAQMKAAGIKITTIAVGDDADVDSLREIADATGGEFYSVRNPATLPRVLIDSVRIINKPLIKTGEFTPVVLSTGSTLTLDMQTAPPLEGLVITAPRPEPRVTIEMQHPDGEPLLAHWQVGLGRAAAFTSDAAGQWSQHWVGWPGFAAFWTQLARTIARPEMVREGELLAVISDGRLNLTFDTQSDDRGFLDDLQVEGRVYRPDGSAQVVRLTQTGPGRYQASVPASEGGNYIVALSPRSGTRRLAPVIGGASQSSSDEFRRYQSNLGLLEQIVDVSRGRRLGLSDPQTAGLFDRTGMQPQVSLVPVWRLMLAAAIALLLLDVACRRLAWSWRGLRSALAGAVARVNPAHLRGREAAATLATLRTSNQQLEQRLSESAQGLPKLRGRSTIQVPRQVEDAMAKLGGDRTAPPDASQVAAALDALLRREQAPSRQVSPGPSPAEGEAAPPPAATETTGNLLAAKRRLREQRP
jgi:uncharacterized membrane protein